MHYRVPKSGIWWLQKLCCFIKKKQDCGAWNGREENHGEIKSCKSQQKQYKERNLIAWNRIRKHDK